MASNCVAPSRERRWGDEGQFLGLTEDYRQTADMPLLVARGVLSMRYLSGERFRGCTEPLHVHDVLLSEGDYARPVEANWRAGYDRRAKAARERVRKRRQRED